MFGSVQAEKPYLLLVGRVKETNVPRTLAGLATLQRGESNPPNSGVLRLSVTVRTRV